MQKDLYISTEDYNYQLPDHRIAKYPVNQREASKLLLYGKKGIKHGPFSSLPAYLPENSELFFNNTRVIHARLKFRRSTGANIEIFCLSPANPVDYQLSFSSHKSCSWYCMIGNLKKWKGDILKLNGMLNSREFTLEASKIKVDQNRVLINFKWDDEHTFAEIIEAVGLIPIPPYLNRESEELDSARYQTVYSKKDGSVAAPTAGLHFTPEAFEKIRQRNISLNELTLHVGAGTFQPLKSENAMQHKMHSEFFTLSVEAIEKLVEEKKTIATGTTTLRTLESLYWLAAKSISENKVFTKLDQWEYKQINCTQPKKKIFQKFVNLLRKENLQSFSAYTSIMIVPGYRFKMADALITNFHQPQSTLLLLIAAFIGEDWKKVYDYALKNDFRFLSYGDSSLLWKA